MGILLALTTSSQASDSAYFSIVSQDGAPPGQVVRKLAVKVPNASVYSLDLRLTYDPTNAAVLQVQAGSLATGMAMAANAANGVIRAGLATGQPVGGEGDVLVVTFQSTQPVQMQFSSASVNEGAIPAENWNLDSDGDGFSDKEEYLAGTNPTNSSDALCITGVEPVQTNECINVQTVLGNAYCVERNTNFPTGDWVQVGGDVIGTGGVLQILDAEAAGLRKGVYRVRIIQ